MKSRRVWTVKSEKKKKFLVRGVLKGSGQDEVKTEDFGENGISEGSGWDEVKMGVC